MALNLKSCQSVSHHARHINFTNWMLTSFGWYTRPVEHLEIHCPPSHQWRVPLQWAASSHTDLSQEHSLSHSTNRSIMTVSFLSVSWPHGFHSLFWNYCAQCFHISWLVLVRTLTQLNFKIPSLCVHLETSHFYITWNFFVTGAQYPLITLHYQKYFLTMGA